VRRLFESPDERRFAAMLSLPPLAVFGLLISGKLAVWHFITEAAKCSTHHRRMNACGSRERCGTISAIIHGYDPVSLLSCRADVSGHSGLPWSLNRKPLTAPDH
ncbi:hypothetical protein N9258_03265, partial [Akkermansiaceae bacterium]|nr:hypothetical protein [Akkermansiaceae bacterium]